MCTYIYTYLSFITNTLNIIIIFQCFNFKKLRERERKKEKKRKRETETVLYILNIFLFTINIDLWYITFSKVLIVIRRIKAHCDAGKILS